MENWGLTTYREVRLLFDPERSSTSDKLGITKVIAHELAHQVEDLNFSTFYFKTHCWLTELHCTLLLINTASPQWFGNLVTMQWWNDLWLNEGFAKFMEFVSTNITYPELQVVRLSGFRFYIMNIQVTEGHIVVRLGIWTPPMVLKTVHQSCIWLSVLCPFFIQAAEIPRVCGKMSKSSRW